MGERQTLPPYKTEIDVGDRVHKRSCKAQMVSGYANTKNKIRYNSINENINEPQPLEFTSAVVLLIKMPAVGGMDTQHVFNHKKSW